MKVQLFGADVAEIQPTVAKHAGIDIVEENPDVVICYGGDGTLLSAELRWPGVPKVPIRNSARGHRLIDRPVDEVLTRLTDGSLHRCEYLKLECLLHRPHESQPEARISAMNEVNVHMGRINSAVRYKLWIDGAPFDEGDEIIGDGFLVSTPFGSTAYWKQIARGVLYTGIGIAFKLTPAVVNHVVVSDDAQIEAEITRGPAVLAYDSAPEYYDLREGDRLLMRRDPQPATLLTWDEMKHPTDAF